MNLQTASTSITTGNPRHVPSVQPQLQTFPRLQEIIRTTETAMAARDAETIVARLSRDIAPLITNLAGRLPSEFLRVSPEGQRRIELHHDPVLGYQILALVWGPGQGTALHDHAGSWGIEAVWCGNLLVAEYVIEERSDDAVKLRPSKAEHVGPGQIVTVTPAQNIHMCRNTSTREVTVSLHIYGTALDEVTEYAPLGDGWHQAARRWLPLEAAGPADLN